MSSETDSPTTQQLITRIKRLEEQNAALEGRVAELEETVDDLRTKLVTKSTLTRLLMGLCGDEHIGDTSKPPSFYQAEVNEFGSQIDALENVVETHETRIQSLTDDTPGSREAKWHAIVKRAIEHDDHPEHVVQANDYDVVLYKKQIAAACDVSERQAQNYIEEFGDEKTGATWRPYQRAEPSSNHSARKKQLLVDLDEWREVVDG